jgi:hypothetical protein
VAAAASNSNSEPTKTSIYSSGPSTSTSKEEHILLSWNTFDFFLQPDPESHNVNKKKKTTAILTDTPDKNALKKLQCTSRSK